MANRLPALLKKAADAFENGQDPFCGAWLSENEVTSDECFKLSDQISSIIRGYLAMKPVDQMEHLAIGVLYKEAPDIIEGFKNQLKLKRTLEEMKKLNGGKGNA